MFRKVRLDNKSTYERLAVVLRMAAMLKDHLEGHCSVKSLGCEQGDLAHWDDIVLRHVDDALEHVQIKDQNTAFCTKSCERPASNPAISTLDDALASLAIWYSDPLKRTEKRSFRLEVVTTGVLLKRDLEIWRLEELVRHIRTGNIDIELLKQRAQSDTGTANIYTWLTTWCKFNDWEHIVAVLCRFEIAYQGTEGQLRDHIKDKLSHHFEDSQEAMDKLVVFALNTTSDISVTDAPSLLNVMRPWLRSDCQTWTQYCHNLPTGEWKVSGTNECPAGEIEPPGSVVNSLWDAGTKARALRVLGEMSEGPNNPSLEAAILRLALHLKGACKAELPNPDQWRSRAKDETGNTFGIQPDDINSATWIASNDANESASYRPIDTPTLVGTEASKLNQVMDDVTWHAVKQAMVPQLQLVADTEYRTALLSLWSCWRLELDGDSQARGSLLTAMLYPDGEGMDAERRVRLGPQTIQLLVIGLEMVLMFALATSGEAATWNVVSNGGEARMIALSHWSGRPSNKRTVRSIAFDGVEALLGTETRPKYLLLAGTPESSTEILQFGMADDMDVSTSMAKPPSPTIITRSTKLQQVLYKGKAENAVDHFKKLIGPNETAIAKAIASYKTGA